MADKVAQGGSRGGLIDPFASYVSISWRYASAAAFSTRRWCLGPPLTHCRRFDAFKSPR